VAAFYHYQGPGRQSPQPLVKRRLRISPSPPTLGRSALGWAAPLRQAARERRPAGLAGPRGAYHRPGRLDQRRMFGCTPPRWLTPVTALRPAPPRVQIRSSRHSTRTLRWGR